MVRLTVKQWMYFVSVAQQGGIAQASRALNISQPAVAQALDKIEHQFNLQLFKRHHAKGVELTPQGRALLNPAKELIAQAIKTEEAAYAIGTNRAGVIRLGCFHTIAPNYLSRIIADYSAEYPLVTIKPYELQQDEIVPMLESGKIDLAITYDMFIEHGAISTTILARLPPFLLLNAEHPLASQEVVSFKDIEKEPFVMFEGPSSREYYQQVLSSVGIKPAVAYRSKSMESVRSAVANGLGYSLAVMEASNETGIYNQRIVQAKIAEFIEPLDLVLLMKGSTDVPSQVGLLSRFIIDYFLKK